eukprot:12258221-Prorocentrum_lima.AAC.1
MCIRDSSTGMSNLSVHGRLHRRVQPPCAHPEVWNVTLRMQCLVCGELESHQHEAEAQAQWPTDGGNCKHLRGWAPATKVA